MKQKKGRATRHPGADGPQTLDVLGPVHGYGMARRISAASVIVRLSRLPSPKRARPFLGSS